MSAIPDGTGTAREFDGFLLYMYIIRLYESNTDLLQKKNEEKNIKFPINSFGPILRRIWCVLELQNVGSQLQK